MTLLALALAPRRADAFKLGRVAGGPVRATLVEGTSQKGGVQPDFLVDETKDDALHGLLERARAIGDRGAPREQRVREVYELVRRSLTWAHGGAPTEYEDPDFRALLATYRGAGRPIPLGEYARHGLGDCRAHFLVLHLALLKAGIDNEAVYASIRGGPVSQAPSSQEGHGFVVLRGGADDGRVLDSYYPPFNGSRLKDLESSRGIARDEGRGQPLRVLAVRPYPRVLPAAHVDAEPITPPPSVQAWPTIGSYAGRARIVPLRWSPRVVPIAIAPRPALRPAPPPLPLARIVAQLGRPPAPRVSFRPR